MRTMSRRDGTTSIYIPDGWHLNTRRVAVPPVPRKGRVRREEIRRHRLILPPDLREEPAFALDSDMWDKFRMLEWDALRHADFLDDSKFDYGPASEVRHGNGRGHAPGPPPPPPPVVKVEEDHVLSYHPPRLSEEDALKHGVL
jgi:hypothetical protein